MRLPVLDLLRLHWDRAAALGCLAFAILALILGYVGVSRTAYTVEQIPYVISGGITGLLLLGVGATLYLSADLRDEWRKLDELHRDVTVGGDASPTEELQLALATLQRRVAALEVASDTMAAGTDSSVNGSSVPTRSRRQSSAARRG